MPADFSPRAVALAGGRLARLIVLLTGLGFVTVGLGLMVVIPLLGYATWHGYVDTIDASEWPESRS